MARPHAISVQELVEAAARVFERKGFVESTISDAAAEAGVSKPTVYQYVQSKRRLLEIIVDQFIYPLRHGIEEVLQSDDPTRTKLERYIRLQVTAAVRHRSYHSVLVADQHQLSPEALRTYLTWAKDVNNATERLLRRGVDEQLLRPDLDVPTVVNLLNGMLTTVGRWYRPGGRISPEELVDQVMSLLSGYIIPAEPD